MSELRESLKCEFRDREYREAYADSFVDTFVAMQIRAIREQRRMTQKDLAERIGTTQTGVSRLENANYSGRSISALKNVARRLDCWLRVSFESYALLIEEADRFGEEALRRTSFEDDPIFSNNTSTPDVCPAATMQQMTNPTAQPMTNTVLAGASSAIVLSQGNEGAPPAVKLKLANPGGNRTPASRLPLDAARQAA